MGTLITPPPRRKGNGSLELIVFGMLAALLVLVAIPMISKVMHSENENMQIMKSTEET